MTRARGRVQFSSACNACGSDAKSIHEVAPATSFSRSVEFDSLSSPAWSILSWGSLRPASPHLLPWRRLYRPISTSPLESMSAEPAWTEIG